MRVSPEQKKTDKGKYVATVKVDGTTRNTLDSGMESGWDADFSLYVTTHPAESKAFIYKLPV